MKPQPGSGELAIRFVADHVGIPRSDIRHLTATHVVTNNWRRVPHGMELVHLDNADIQEAIKRR